MAVANLNSVRSTFGDGKSSVVLVDNFQSVRGGRTLDVTGYNAFSILTPGHVIIKETATNEYKPMPVGVVANVATYGALPVGHTYAGILINEIPTAKPFAGICVRGTINPNAAPFDFATIATAFKSALPLIDQRAD